MTFVCFVLFFNCKTIQRNGVTTTKCLLTGDATGWLGPACEYQPVEKEDGWIGDETQYVTQYYTEADETKRRQNEPRESEHDYKNIAALRCNWCRSDSVIFIGSSSASLLVLIITRTHTRNGISLASYLQCSFFFLNSNAFRNDRVVEDR